MLSLNVNLFQEVAFMVHLTFVVKKENKAGSCLEVFQVTESKKENPLQLKV